MCAMLPDDEWKFNNRCDAWLCERRTMLIGSTCISPYGSRLECKPEKRSTKRDRVPTLLPPKPKRILTKHIPLGRAAGLLSLTAFRLQEWCRFPATFYSRVPFRDVWAAQVPIPIFGRGRCELLSIADDPHPPQNAPTFTPCQSHHSHRMASRRDRYVRYRLSEAHQPAAAESKGKPNRLRSKQALDHRWPPAPRTDACMPTCGKAT